MIDGRGYVRLPEARPPPVRRTIAIGAKVRITAGPFGGMSGLYAGMSTKDRERVSLYVRRADARSGSHPISSFRRSEEGQIMDREETTAAEPEHETHRARARTATHQA